MTLTIVQLAEMYRGATGRINTRIKAQENSRNSVFYSPKDEQTYLNDLDTLTRSANRLKQAIIRNL